MAEVTDSTSNISDQYDLDDILNPLKAKASSVPTPLLRPDIPVSSGGLDNSPAPVKTAAPIQVPRIKPVPKITQPPVEPNIQAPNLADYGITPPQANPANQVAKQISQQPVMQPPDSGMTLGQLTRQRAAAAEPINRNDPKYRMPMWQRVVGTLGNALEGAATKGRATPTYVGPGATNNRYDTDVSAQQQRVANLDEQIKQQQGIAEENRKAYETASTAEAKKETAEAAGEKAEAAKLTAQQKMPIEQMKLAAQNGRIATVKPAKDNDGNITWMAYDRLGNPIKELDGSIPPAQYLDKTRFTQNADGTWTSSTTKVGVPGTKTKPVGAPAPSTPSATPRSSSTANPKSTTAPSSANWWDKPLDKMSPIESGAIDLVEGNKDPSQVSARGALREPMMKLAKEYSQGKYKQPFNEAQATIDYTYAKNPGTQNTLKYMNSLTGGDNKSGNLGTLIDISNKIDRTDFPAVNNVEAWTRMQTGNPAISGYYTAVLEVSDQVGKILQGGGTGNGTSDAKLAQAQKLFNTGFSKDVMKEVATTLRSLLGNRKKEMIGNNTYLKRQYGEQSQSSQSNKSPHPLQSKYPKAIFD